MNTRFNPRSPRFVREGLGLCVVAFGALILGAHALL